MTSLDVGKNGPPEKQQALQKEIANLEERLRIVRSQLQSSATSAEGCHQDAPQRSERLIDTNLGETSNNRDYLHTLLLLADSALPLGSFAFSSGLESCLAHRRGTAPPRMIFDNFMLLSLQSLASTALPHVFAAYTQPERLLTLDNDFDASTPCTVARRASVAQGKALLSVWERSFATRYRGVISDVSRDCTHAEAFAAIETLSNALRKRNDALLPSTGHLAPLWGTITRVLGLPFEVSAYLFLFSHARTIVSAAVRSSVFGPYQAQTVLANAGLKTHIEALIEESQGVPVEDAGQAVPAVDIWMGRHELLYSRIFNS